MDAKVREHLRQVFEQAVQDLLDVRGEIKLFKRPLPSEARPVNMPRSIVMQHLCGAFVGLLRRPLAEQEATVRRHAAELLRELVGPRDGMVFLEEDHPIEFWHVGDHLHFLWRVGAAAEYEEQTEVQFIRQSAGQR